MAIRVRLSETDALGVVYYGQYFSYFDLARLEMLRKAGITLEFLRRRKLGFVAAKAACRYLSSLKFDDKFTVRVEVARLGNASVEYRHTITKGRKRIAEGEVTDVMVKDVGGAAKIPEDIRKRLLRFG